MAFPAGYLGGTTGPSPRGHPVDFTSGSPAYIIGNSGDYNWWTESGNIKLLRPGCGLKSHLSYRNNQYGFGYGSPQSFLRDFFGNTVFSNAGVNGVPISVSGAWPLSPSDFISNNDKGAYMENIFHGDYQTKVFGDSILKISAGFINTPTNHYDEIAKRTVQHVLRTRTDLHDSFRDVRHKCAALRSSLRKTPADLWRRISLR